MRVIGVVFSLGLSVLLMGAVSVAEVVPNAVVPPSYTLEMALERLETHGPLTVSFKDQKIQAEAAIQVAGALNNSSLNVGIITGIYRQWDRVGPEDPSLPDNYKELEDAMYNNDFLAPRLSTRVGLSKPIWDSGLTRSRVKQSRSQYEIMKWRYRQQLLIQKKILISLYFLYQTLDEQIQFLYYKRDNLSQLISEKVPSKKVSNTAQELMFKQNVLDYEESLFLLSQVEQKKERMYVQLLELLGYLSDETVVFNPKLSGKVVDSAQNIKLISPEEQLAREQYSHAGYALDYLRAQRKGKATFNGFYVYNVLSTQMLAGEIQVLFPIKHTGVVKAKINSVESQLNGLKRRIDTVRSQQTIKRHQLKTSIDVLNEQLVLTDRRRLLADQEWGLKKESFQQGLLAFEASFNSELLYRKALFMFKEIKYSYLEKVYYYNELIKGAQER